MVAFLDQFNGEFIDEQYNKRITMKIEKEQQFSYFF
jgi:hypothetical protein